MVLEDRGRDKHLEPNIYWVIEGRLQLTAEEGGGGLCDANVSVVLATTGEDPPPPTLAQYQGA